MHLKGGLNDASLAEVGLAGAGYPCNAEECRKLVQSLIEHA